MRIKILASGSSGNCTYIETKDHKILIDVGISKKSIEQELLNIGSNLKAIDTLLITHEHIDHIKSLGTILKTVDLTCYMTSGTYNAIVNENSPLSATLAQKYNAGYIILLNRLENSILYQDVFLDEILIKVLPTFHDAAEPCGFKIVDDSMSIVYLTDTGYVHQAIYELITNANCYVLECNHDPYILMSSNRTYSLKMRILSDHGHLSNEDAFVTLAKIMGEQTKLVFYAHISQECNLTEIIELTRKKVMTEIGIDTSNVDFVVTSPIATKVYDL